MSATRIQAVYRDTGVEAYRDNPLSRPYHHYKSQ